MRLEFILSLLAALIVCRAQAAPSAAESDQGGNLFAATCSSSFCHGEEGAGARGPSLKNRNFTPDFVRNTVLEGRSGTPMPSFKDSLSSSELNMIVAYVMSLSPNNHSGNSGPAIPAPVAPVLQTSASAQLGQRIFFDLSRRGACAACHSYRQRGGPVGPDLTAIARRLPQDIYQSLVRPTAPNLDYPAVTVTTDGGKSFHGILKQKTDAVVQLYDLSSLPPVLRSFHGAQISVEPTTSVHIHDVSDLSAGDLADLITFLKSADDAPKDVTPADLRSP